MSSQPRILAVDDESLIRMSLRIALKREGYVVDTASCARDAMAMLDRLHYDLILLDLRLPDLSGLEVLRYARLLDPEVKVLLITASTNAPSKSEAMREGAVGILSKPFPLSVLAAETRRAMGTGSSRVRR